MFVQIARFTGTSNFYRLVRTVLLSFFTSRNGRAERPWFIWKFRRYLPKSNKPSTLGPRLLPCFAQTPVTWAFYRRSGIRAGVSVKTFTSDPKGNTLRTGSVADSGEGGYRGTCLPIKGLRKNFETVDCIKVFE